jgi:hypothetical protein
MHIVQIEHATTGYDTWKRAFDSDPAGREQGGVRRYRIARPVDDPDYIVVDLEFDDRERAVAFRGALERMWATPQAQQVLGGTPQVRLVETVESVAF